MRVDILMTLLVLTTGFPVPAVAADGAKARLVLQITVDQPVYNTEDDRHHLIGKAPKPHEGASPRQLLASTIGDELVVHGGGRSRVWSVSVKDRGAIIPGGHAGKAFWFSKSSGEFVTSTYYYEAYPDWVKVPRAPSGRRCRRS